MAKRVLICLAYTLAVLRLVFPIVTQWLAVPRRCRLPRSHKRAYLVEAAEKSWRRLDGHNQLPKIILGVKFTDGIEVARSQAQTTAP